MDVAIEICELKVLEFGYYTLQVSVEDATNNGTLQVNCTHSGAATNCGQMNLKFDQNYSSIIVSFLIIEQGDSSTVIATGTSTIFTENHHSKLFHNVNTDNVMQSVMMSIPSDCEELHRYFGTYHHI